MVVIFSFNASIFASLLSIATESVGEDCAYVSEEKRKPATKKAYFIVINFSG